jgi:hypothetical protein
MTELEKTVTALEALAKIAEQANHWTDTERLMPATGVADTIYEALDLIRTIETLAARRRDVLSLIAVVGYSDNPAVSAAIARQCVDQARAELREDKT